MKHTVHEIRLKNGARGLLIDVPSATVASFQIHFRAGSRYTAHSDAYETAHIMEHMAFGANGSYKDAHAFDAEFTKNGAYHNAFTSDLSMVYVADCADFEWDRILDLQKAAITTPKFNSDELVSETGNVKNELTGYLNHHGRLLWPRLQQALGEDILNYEERVKLVGNVTLAHIKEHYRRTHTLKNMRFVITGKLSGRIDQIKEHLESWALPAGERLELPRDTLHAAKPFIVRRKEASNITFAWSMVIPRQLKDDELDAMSCVDHLLTGTLHSKILGKARRQGLTYGMFSDVTSYQHDSSWDFGGQVNSDTADRLFDIIVEEVRNILAGNIAEEEIEAAKQYALGKHQMGCQTVAGIGNWYADRYFFDERIEDFDHRPTAIKAITKQRMLATAKEFAEHKRWVLGAVGNEKLETIRALDAKLTGIFE